MKKTYKTNFEAEQFDGSKEMAKEYEMLLPPAGEYYVNSVDGFRAIREGDWLISNGEDIGIVDDDYFEEHCELVEEKEIPPVYLVWQVMKPDEHEYNFETANKSLIGIFDTEDHAREFLHRGFVNMNRDYNTEAEVNEFTFYYRYLMVHDDFGLPLIDYWIEERNVWNQ